MHHDQSVGHIGCASRPRNDFIDGRIDPTRAMERCRQHRADTWESHPNEGWSNSLFCWYFPRQGPCWIRILLELGALWRMENVIPEHLPNRSGFASLWLHVCRPLAGLLGKLLSLECSFCWNQRGLQVFKIKSGFLNAGCGGDAMIALLNGLGPRNCPAMSHMFSLRSWDEDKVGAPTLATTTTWVTTALVIGDRATHEQCSRGMWVLFFRPIWFIWVMLSV